MLMGAATPVATAACAGPPAARPAEVCMNASVSALSFSPLISFSIACKMHLCLVKYSVKGSFASAPRIRSTSIVVAIGWKTSRGITVATFSERMFRSVFRPGIAVMSKMLYPCGRRNFRGARFADGRLQAHVARRGGRRAARRARRTRWHALATAPR